MLVPRPVPLFVRGSITMRLEFSCQATSVTGQVVRETSSSVVVPSASTFMLLRRTACVACRQLELRAFELHAECRGVGAVAAPYLELGTREFDRARELGVSVLRVVFQAVGADQFVALAHHDIAREHGVAVDIEAEVLVVGLDGDRFVNGFRRFRGYGRGTFGGRGLRADRFIATRRCRR